MRAERAGNRRLREHEFTLLSGLMARISLCRGLRECKLEEGGQDGRVGERRDGEKRYTHGIVDGQPIWIAKLLSQRICNAANGTAGNIIATPIILGIMLINTAKSTFDVR